MSQVRKSTHFFSRENDGSVRLRIRFHPDEASLIEAAAGSVPLLTWIHRTLGNAARAELMLQQSERSLPPPIEETP